MSIQEERAIDREKKIEEARKRERASACEGRGMRKSPSFCFGITNPKGVCERCDYL